MIRRRYARFVVRWRVPILAGWLLATVLAVLALPGIEGAGGGSLGNLVPADSRAIETEKHAAELFKIPVLSRVAVVERNPRGRDAGATVDSVALGVNLTARTLPDFADSIFAAFAIPNDIGPRSFVHDRGTTSLTYLIINPDYGTGRSTRAAERLVREQVGPRSASAGVTGAIPARTAQVGVIADWLPLVELGTILLVGLAVGLHFRSPVAPLLVLIAIAVTYLLAVHVISGIGSEVGISIPKEVEPVMVVLLFGILTDYAIFFLSRFRSRLTAGEDPATAAEGTIADQVGIIMAAGLAVMAAMGSLIVAQLSFFRAFGPGVALSVGIGVLAALSLLPAALAVLGDKVFWPSRPGDRTDALEGGAVRYSRSLLLAARRPWTVIAGSVLVLLVLAAGMLRLQVGQTLIRGLPADSGPRQAYQTAKQGFAAGVVSPTLVLVEGEDLLAQRRDLVTLQKRLAADENVALVVGPRQQPLDNDFGAVYAPGANAARLLVFMRSDPLGAAAIRTVRRIRELTNRVLLARGVPADVSIAGDSAVAAEIVGGSDKDLARIAPVVVVLVGLILAIFLRSLVAPLYMLVASALGLFAAIGLTVLVFQDIAGFSELTYYVPFVAAVLLLALGSDYNAFLAGRVWEEAQSKPLRVAVVEGGSRAASAITVAGIVLSLSFALLALVPLRPFRELGFVMCFGLLIDTFLVRTLLIPALICAVGPASGWPGRMLGRRIDPETVVDDPAAPARV